jgi:hypothetical protein
MNRSEDSLFSATLVMVMAIAVAGCGTTDPMLNMEEILPTNYVDAASLPPEKEYNWKDYHYGHWQYDRGIGWAWIPGYVWSPSQVVWNTGYEHDYTSLLPPPDLLTPVPGETSRALQPSRRARRGEVRGSFDQINLHGIFEKVETRRLVATSRALFRADLTLDFPLALFGPESIAPPGPPPVPHFTFGIP